MREIMRGLRITLRIMGLTLAAGLLPCAAQLEMAERAAPEKLPSDQILQRLPKKFST